MAQGLYSKITARLGLSENAEGQDAAANSKGNIANANTGKPRLLTLKQAADLIDGLTEYRVRSLCRDNIIKFHKFGNKYMVSEKVILDYFAD